MKVIFATWFNYNGTDRTILIVKDGNAIYNNEDATKEEQNAIESLLGPEWKLVEDRRRGKVYRKEYERKD